MKKFWEKVAKIDRRIIFVIMAVAVIVPLLWPIAFPFKASKPVIDAYKFINELPKGQRILLSFDYRPGAAPELSPAALAVVRHCFKKSLRLVAVSLLPEGVPYSEDILFRTAKEYDKTYGKDFIIMGYKSGSQMVIQNMGLNFLKTFPKDFRNKPASEFSIIKGIKDYKDFGLIVNFTDTVFVDYYIIYANTQYGIKVVGSVTAVSAPQIYPYYASGQLTGLLGGLRGSAEYEQLINKPAEATIRMGPQTFGHLAIIIFVVIANIGYFLSRRRK